MPAGITVYWIVSNLLASAQEFFLSGKINREILEQRKIEEEKKAEEKKKKLLAAQMKYQSNKGKQGKKPNVQKPEDTDRTEE